MALPSADDLFADRRKWRGSREGRGDPWAVVSQKPIEGAAAEARDPWAVVSQTPFDPSTARLDRGQFDPSTAKLDKGQFDPSTAKLDGGHQFDPSTAKPRYTLEPPKPKDGSRYTLEPPPSSPSKFTVEPPAAPQSRFTVEPPSAPAPKPAEQWSVVSHDPLPEADPRTARVTPLAPNGTPRRGPWDITAEERVHITPEEYKAQGGPLGDVARAFMGATDQWKRGDEEQRGGKYLKGTVDKVAAMGGVLGAPFAAAGDPIGRRIAPVQGDVEVNPRAARFGAQAAGEPVFKRLSPEKAAERSLDTGNVLAGFIPGPEGVAKAAGALARDAEGVRGLARGGVKLDEKAPGPVYAPGKKAETPIQTSQRVDDALHRLKNSATADKLELQDYLRKVPAEAANPKMQEALHHAIEQKLVNPKAKIPADLQPAYKAIEPLYREQTDLINEIRARSGGEGYGYEEGYVHRIAQGKGHVFDAADTEGLGRTDPITGKRSLSKTTGSLKSRKFAVIVDPKTGKRTFVEGDEYTPGTEIEGSFGKKFQVKQATTREIEANTDVRYHKNALLSTVDNVARLRRVKRNLDVLDSLVADAKARNLAERTEWHYQNDRGEWVRRQANLDPARLRAKGFRETAVPQLKGVWFDKHIADAVDDFYGKDKGDLDNVLTKTNRLLSSSLFITPVPHALNVLGHWVVGRGWDWLNPYGYARAARYGTRAVKEVLSGGSDYRAMLREGSGLMYGDIATENFHKVLLEKMAGDVAADPAMTPIAKSFGLKDAGQLGKAMYDALYKSSNRALWAANDIFMLSRQYELVDKGLPVREAIHEAERDIPNYRIPPQVMGQRWLSEALKSPNYTLFGRYKYGMFRAYASMFRDMFRGSGEARVEAAGKFAALMGLATVALPFADAALQAATGNKDARVHRFGPLSVPQAVADWTAGQRDWAGMLASVVTPAPVLEAGREALTNRDDFGRHIVEPESTPLGKTVQRAEWVASKFYPTSLATEALRPGGAAQAAGRLVDLEYPPSDRELARLRAHRYELRAARARERKDPIERIIRGF